MSLGRNLLIKVLLMSLVALGLKAQANETPEEQAWHGNYGPGLEIANKANNTILVKVYKERVTSTADRDKAVSRLEHRMDKGGVDPDFILEIPNDAKNTTNRKSVGISPNDLISLKVYDPGIGSSEGVFEYIFPLTALNKTKYLTWDPKKTYPLYPQTGPLKGLTGKSESGYRLDNNVQGEGAFKSADKSEMNRIVR